MFKFALDESLQPREIYVNVVGNVAGRHSLRLNKGHRLLEWNCAGWCAFRPTTVRPSVLVAQQLFVFLELLGHILKHSFDSGIRRRGLFSGGHLPGRQAQVQGCDNALARRTFLDYTFKVHQFRTEYLQVSAQLFHLLIDYFFEVGSFGNFVADMNVHIKASPDGRSIRRYIRSEIILLLCRMTQTGKRRLHSGRRSSARRTNLRRRAYLSGILTFTSGRLSTWMVSINRTLLLFSFITSEVVRTPSPKKRTPLSSGPSVTPVAAKTTFFPGARSSAV